MKFLFFIFTLFSTLLVLANTPEAKISPLAKSIDLSQHQSNVEFLAVGKPSMLQINGTGGKLQGHVEMLGGQVAGEFIVPLSTITTGIEMRDQHMKNKYLETEKYPTAILKITEIKFDKDFLKEKGSQKNVPFKGKLTIHGAENDVEGTADIDSSDQFLAIQARTTTGITNYKMDIPSYLGIKVADQVEIKVDMKIKKL